MFWHLPRRMGRSLGFLVVPDTFFWNCPLYFKILQIILHGLGIASSLHSSHFGTNPVNPSFIPFSSFCLIQILFSFHLSHPSWRWNKLEGVDKFIMDYLSLDLLSSFSPFVFH